MLFELENVHYKELIWYPHLVLPKDKITFIVGESGSGKSTLLKLFNNTMSASAGVVQYLGRPVDEYDPIVLRRDVALVSQEAFLFEGNILENFKIFFELREKELPEERQIQQCCHACGIDFDLSKETQKLSGGERHRVYIALFLAFKPKVLMLDEPTAALDQKKTHEVMGGIAGFCKENSMDLIVVSHDPGLMQKYSEETIHLSAKEEAQ